MDILFLPSDHIFAPGKEYNKKDVQCHIHSQVRRLTGTEENTGFVLEDMETNVLADMEFTYKIESTTQREFVRTTVRKCINQRAFYDEAWICYICD